MKHLLIDLHSHVKNKEELQEWKEFFHAHPDSPYRAVITATDSVEAEFLFTTIKQDSILAKYFIPIVGLHPWRAAKGLPELERLMPFFEQSPVLGEIGLDSVWCTVDHTKQVKVFQEQIDIAQRLKKPILLHTKGREAEIIDAIQNFPFTKIIHWYSHQDKRLIEKYIAQNCHFTLGADNANNIETENVWSDVPLHHLHLETDGYEAVLWAREQWPRPEDAPHPIDTKFHRQYQIIESMQERIRTYANMHTLTYDACLQQFEENSLHLFPQFKN